MNFIRRPRNTRLLLVLAVTLIGGLTMAAPAQAQVLVEGATIPAGEVHEGDALMSGAVVLVNGTITGDLFAYGNIVRVNGSVEGSIFAAANSVVINGDVGGSSYLLARTLRLERDAAVARNGYAVAVELTTDSPASVSGDLTMVALQARLSGAVGQRLRGAVAMLHNDGSVGRGGDLDAPASTPQTSDGAGALLTFVRLPAAAATRSLAAQAERTTAAEQAAQEEDVAAARWAAVGDRLREFITLLFFGGLAMWLVPSWLDSSSRQVTGAALRSSGWGIFTVLLAPVLLFLAGALILGLALLLYRLGLGNLGNVMAALGAFGLGAVTTLFWLFVFYGSKIVVAYTAGYLILKRAAPQRQRRLAALVLGLLLYSLLRAIPIVGWVIAIAFTLLGLGAMWLAYQSRPATPLAAAPDTALPMTSEPLLPAEGAIE